LCPLLGVQTAPHDCCTVRCPSRCGGVFLLAPQLNSQDSTNLTMEQS
jgi:hypothetical protein